MIRISNRSLSRALRLLTIACLTAAIIGGIAPSSLAERVVPSLTHLLPEARVAHAQTVETKVLYLSTNDSVGSVQDLDRTDPVATSDSTTAISDLLGTGGETVRDEFGIVAYDNNNGTTHWTNSWSELSDDGSPHSGDVFVSNERLRLQFAGRGATRRADLSAATAAQLSFHISTFDNGNDYWQVEANDGSGWVTLEVFSPVGGPGSTDVLERNETKSYQLENYISLTSNVEIRFLVTQGFGQLNIQYVTIDDVQISYDSLTSASTVFTQTLPMASDFFMPAGGIINVTTHISGTLPTNPDVTATLKKADGAVITTLTNPTLSSSVLTWTGAVPSDTTVLTGEQVVLEITSNETGSTFQIEYDSSTKPSRIELSTTTVINVDSLVLYDAAYPGGTAVTDTFNGTTLYVRVTVSDPFGPSDITSVDMTINDPVAGPTNVTLTDSDVVATSSSTKTYEYAWEMGNNPGVHDLVVTAHEGHEGTVSDSATVQVTLAVASNTPLGCTMTPAFTGDVVTDFTMPGVVTLMDTSPTDVGLPPQAPADTISGNDIEDVRICYDAATDTLYVGINAYGIAGDVDGNGDPADSSDWLIGNAGNDDPDFSNTESFALMIDTDEDNIYDVIAGVSGLTGISGFAVSSFTGSPYTPGYAFGTPLPAHIGAIFGSPTASQPDLEFTILNFSTLPSSSGSDTSLSFGANAFMGSFGDDGIGEDFLPGPGTTVQVNLGSAAIDIHMTPDYQMVLSGASANFHVAVTNTGTVVLNNVMVSDPLAPACDNVIGTLAPGTVFEYDCVASGVTMSFTNTATAAGQDGSGNPVSDSDDAVVEVINPAIDIQVTPDLQRILVGEDASFQITVQNSGNVDLVNVAVSDPLVPVCDNTIGNLAAGANITYECSAVGVTTDFTNVANASGQDPFGNTVNASDNGAVDVINPVIDIQMTPDLQMVPSAGDALFHIMVTNVGDVNLVNVTVSDPLVPACDNSIGALAVGATIAYDCTATGVVEDFTNVATANGQDSDGHPVSDSDDGVVDVTDPNACVDGVDLAMIFDHTGSMDDVVGKIENAKSAARSFIHTFAGGITDSDLSPHQMALVGFYNSIAATDVPLTTDADALRTAINNYVTSGGTNIGTALSLGQIQLNNAPQERYMVLLSDGAANSPYNLLTGGTANEFYLDVNNNGVVDNDDDLSVTYPGSTTPNFVVTDGRWSINDSYDLTHALDVNRDGDVNSYDNYNFGTGINFRIIRGALYLDANGDGHFAENANNIFTLGHDDELTVESDGSVWAGQSSFSGDGSDVYAQYWATQTKLAGTYLYVIGYELGPEQDNALLAAMASPNGYFDSGSSNINQIFEQVALSICGDLTPIPDDEPQPQDGFIVNGDFEAGRYAGWNESSTHSYTLVTNGMAHNGTWLAWLGGANNETSKISQEITVPSTGATLTYWYRISSSDWCGYDYGYVRINNTTLKTYNLCSSSSTSEYVQDSVNLNAFAGQTVTLRFKATNDYVYESSLYIDDVSFANVTAAAQADGDEREPTIQTETRLDNHLDWMMPADGSHGRQPNDSTITQSDSIFLPVIRK